MIELFEVDSDKYPKDSDKYPKDSDKYPKDAIRQRIDRSRSLKPTMLVKKIVQIAKYFRLTYQKKRARHWQCPEVGTESL